MSQQAWIYKFFTACTYSTVQAVFQHRYIYLASILVLLITTLSGCHSKIGSDLPSVFYNVTETSDDFSPPHYPSFQVQNGNLPYNVIGTPQAILQGDKPLIQVSNDTATLYVDKQRFKTDKATYTNYIYRVHFSKVPFGLFNLNITAGNNPGLLIIYTVDSQDQIVLITTVHTCGCYLAFFPTSNLAQESLPPKWPESRQTVFGYQLPSLVPSLTENLPFYTFTLASGTHRVVDVTTTAKETGTSLPRQRQHLTVMPMTHLYELPYEGSTVSFFETEGPRKGYVKNSSKPLERLLISWWAFDWYVGEDKAYGRSASTEPPFYTSLKFWQRDNSDMKNFSQFLAYWGWRL